jgi:hypothetical protein
MKLLDAWRLMNVIAEVEAAAEDLEGIDPGGKKTVSIPDAHKVGALLIRGKAGARYRIQSVVLVREK